MSPELLGGCRDACVPAESLEQTFNNLLLWNLPQTSQDAHGNALVKRCFMSPVCRQGLSEIQLHTHHMGKKEFWKRQKLEGVCVQRTPYSTLCPLVLVWHSQHCRQCL